MDPLSIASSTLNQLILPWLSFGSSVLANKYNRDFATMTNKQEQENWETALRLNQSNFENQYQITSRDMRSAGFNPMALFSGGQLNQVPSVQASPDLQGSVSQRNAFSELIQNYSNLALTQAQTKKLEAETKHISEEHEFVSSENALDRDLQQRMQDKNIDLEKWLAEYDRDTQLVYQERDNAAKLLRQNNENSLKMVLATSQRMHEKEIQKIANEHEKDMQQRKQLFESMENEFNRATETILTNMKIASDEYRLESYLRHDLKKYQAQLAVDWARFGVQSAHALSSELRSWLSAVATGGLSQIGSGSSLNPRDWTY